MDPIERLVAACVDCLAADDVRRAVQQTLSQAMRSPEDVPNPMREDAAGITVLHRGPDLTVLDVVWAPGMRMHPHDHRMWAVVAVYAGAEVNDFFRRAGDTLAPSHRRRLQAGDVIHFGEDTVHAVHNPGATPSGAIHVYGGDVLAVRRSQWVPPELRERPYDTRGVAHAFAEANTTWQGMARHA